MDDDTMSTVGILDVLDVMKVFAEGHCAEDTLPAVRERWHLFTQEKVKRVFGTWTTVYQGGLFMF